MAHRTHTYPTRSALRALLAALAASSALAGCYETSPPEATCTTEFAPVCGDDDVTYANTCRAEAAGAAVLRAGPCRTGNACTTDHECDIGALCEVPRCGEPLPAPECEPGADCPAPPSPRCLDTGLCEACECADVYAPVCGADGVTYGNECEARCAHATIASSGACGTRCEPRPCPAIFCEFGYVIDAGGCSTCECNPPPMCPPLCDLYCPFGNVIDERGCETCSCNPEPICPEVLCAIECEYGTMTDERGCSTCMCNPPPPTGLCENDSACGAGEFCDFSAPTCAEPACLPDAPCPPSTCWGSCRPRSTCVPVLCDLYCEFGFARDASGCETCTCNVPPPPPPPVRLCLADSGCAPDERCDHSVCFAAPCAPGMACPDVCYGACTSAPPTEPGMPLPRPD